MRDAEPTHVCRGREHGGRAAHRRPLVSELVFSVETSCIIFRGPRRRPMLIGYKVPSGELRAGGIRVHINMMTVSESNKRTSGK